MNVLTDVDSESDEREDEDGEREYLQCVDSVVFES